MGRPLIDVTGQRFGRITVLKRVSEYRETPVRWLCQCDCGKEFVTVIHRFVQGRAKSCGCYQREMIGDRSRKHGLSHTRLFKTWSHMIERCTCATHKQFSDYGGRGIKVCEEWKKDFMNFYDWAINNGYTEELTIDRIDVNGNYEPSNCRWADSYTQQNNTRRTINITVNGVTKTLSEWSKETGISKGTLASRYSRGKTGVDFLKPVI